MGSTTLRNLGHWHLRSCERDTPQVRLETAPHPRLARSSDIEVVGAQRVEEHEHGRGQDAARQMGIVYDPGRTTSNEYALGRTSEAPEVAKGVVRGRSYTKVGRGEAGTNDGLDVAICRHALHSPHEVGGLYEVRCMLRLEETEELAKVSL
jgi:hypothetical protein